MRMISEQSGLCRYAPVGVGPNVPARSLTLETVICSHGKDIRVVPQQIFDHAATPRNSLSCATAMLSSGVAASDARWERARRAVEDMALFSIAAAVISRSENQKRANHYLRSEPPASGLRGDLNQAWPRWSVESGDSGDLGTVVTARGPAGDAR